MSSRLLVLAAHATMVGWLFGGAFSSGAVLFFRDVSSYYAPVYASAATALHQGVWPLWNPTANAGEPLLVAYPVDLALLLWRGWPGPLGIGVALHLLIALAGASHLAERLDLGAWGSWFSGTVYGIGGLVLSLVNLMPLFHAAAWAPWVITVFLDLTRRFSRRRLAVLAVLLALQASTLGAEIVLQTAVVAVVLAVQPSRRCLARLLGIGIGAGALAALLAAPALAGVAALVASTARARGFAGQAALGFSLHPAALPEAIAPRWLGEPHAFSDADYWGRALFPYGFPYFLTLYLGVAVFLLALQAAGRRRLWWLAACGLFLALGDYGPLALIGSSIRSPLRGPQKLLFLTHLAVALLAGAGLARRLRQPPSRATGAALVFVGVSCLALTFTLHLWPDQFRGVLSHLVPQLSDPRGALTARATWPRAWIPSSVLACGACLALAQGRRLVPLAAIAATIDLATVNGAVNPLAPVSFYRLRDEITELLRPTRERSRGRLFSYGLAQTPGLRFEPIMGRASSDVWLYYLDRQTLLPLTPALDGFDGAFNVDRTGWAPDGATFSDKEAVPEHFAECHGRLRRAAVQWVLSFRELPANRVIERGRLKLTEIIAPLRLYELKEALPRAYYVPSYEVVEDPQRRRARLEDVAFDPRRTVLLERAPPAPWVGGSGAGMVEYQPVDAHTVRILVDTPPGFIVVSDGFHPAWTAESTGGPVPILRANDRYRAIPTPGGRQVFTMRYRPAWLFPSLVAFAIGFLAVLGLYFFRGTSESSGESGAC